jgi:hypothetical protein
VVGWHWKLLSYHQPSGFHQFFQVSLQWSCVGSVSSLSPEIHTRRLYACTALEDYKCRGMKLKLNEQLEIWVGIRKFLDCFCCNWLGERRWEGMPRSHFQKPMESVCHVKLRCEHALLLHECYFTSWFVLSAMYGKIEQTRLHQVLHVAQ